MRQLTGLKEIEFQEIVEKARSECGKWKNSYGRKSHIKTLEDKILCVLIYYRTYITHPFLGYLFNLHNSNICRLQKKMVSEKNHDHKTRKNILVDVTESPTQRPKDSKKRKKSYSDKKKTTTMKTEIVIEESGQILSVSRSHRGRILRYENRRN